MKYFVLVYNVSEYSGWACKEFEHERSALAFINEHAGEEGWDYTVIRGQEIELEPIEVVKSYRFKLK